jgi:hypothetical protein
MANNSPLHTNEDCSKSNTLNDFVRASSRISNKTTYYLKNNNKNRNEVIRENINHDRLDYNSQYDSYFTNYQAPSTRLFSNVSRFVNTGSYNVRARHLTNIVSYLIC